MKKFLLAVCALSLFASESNAQAPTNMGLETWTTIPFNTIKDPDNWASFNALKVAGMNQTVFEETAAPYEATTSAKIVTEKIVGATVPGYDTVGLLVLGSVNIGIPPTINYGKPFDDMPATLTFAMKYAPATSVNYPTDTCSVLVQLTKYNTTSHKADTIASAKFETSAAVSAWTVQTIDLTPTYVSTSGGGAAPDTLKIYCSSSSLIHPNIGSTLYVDDFQFHGWVGINEINGVKNTVSLFPNPATNNVTIQCSVNAAFAEVMDIAGRKMGTFSMENNQTRIETTGYAAGIYLFNVKDKDGKVVNRGKFEVTK